jgi:hypothetical protein
VFSYLIQTKEDFLSLEDEGSTFLSVRQHQTAGNRILSYTADKTSELGRVNILYKKINFTYSNCYTRETYDISLQIL